MVDDAVSSIAAGITGSITGAGTPDHVAVKRPAKGVIWSLFATLAIIAIGVAVIINLLAYPKIWMPTEPINLARIKGLAWIGWLLCGDIVLLVFAICTPWVGQVSASAGNNKIELGARTDD